MLKKTVVVASLVALALAATAYAGNGAGSNKSSSSYISPPIVVSSALSATSTSGPQYRDWITFDVSTTATSNPYVNLYCYQNGTLVLRSTLAYFAGNKDGAFGLYSSWWTGGAADCTANLDMPTNSGKWKTLTSTSFHVDA